MAKDSKESISSQIELNEEAVAQIAQLAALKVDSSSNPQILKEMNQILNYFREIESIDCDQLEPMFSPLDQPAPLRPDTSALDSEIRNENQQKTVQENAPELVGNLYQVPPVVSS